jgi:hypothetical protein
MIDIESETLIDLCSACRLPVFVNQKTRRPCGIASMYRYILRGARAANGDRIKLETIKTPTGTRTSREAVERFIRALSDPDTPVAAPRSRVREKQIEEANSELIAAGF